jgi:hypothetical protein
MRPRILRPLLLLLLAATLALPALAAAPQPRPYTGRGVLLLRPFTPERTAELDAIPLYREPGVGRLAEFAAGRLPQVTQLIAVPAGTYAVAVLEKRGAWLRVAYDDSGRAGWLERARWWNYLAWEEYLPGRTVSLPPGLKAGLYRLCAKPEDSAPQLAALPAGTAVLVMGVHDDWLRVALPPDTTGWLRWRDTDGRLLITVVEQISPQNY